MASYQCYNEIALNETMLLKELLYFHKFVWKKTKKEKKGEKEGRREAGRERGRNFPF